MILMVWNCKLYPGFVEVLISYSRDIILKKLKNKMQKTLKTKRGMK